MIKVPLSLYFYNKIFVKFSSLRIQLKKIVSECISIKMSL